MKNKKKGTLAILGGKPSIEYKFKTFNSIGKDEFRAVKKVMKSGILSKFIGKWDKDFYGGVKILEFENDCKEYFKVKHAISVNSWTSGLICAVGAIDVNPGDEIILPPWTMSASAMAILHWNAVPVFCDISRSDYCLDPDLIEALITDRTKAIMAVDIFGLSANMDKVIEIARKHNLKVISDSAQAPGAMLNGVHAGTMADIGGISFNYHKHIHTGEGGMLFTNDDHLANKMRLIRNHGESVVEDMNFTDIVNIVGFNFRLGEIEAAIGIEQLKKLNKIVIKKQEIAKSLIAIFNKYPGIVTPAINEQRTNVFYTFPIQFDEFQIGIKRSTFVAALRAEGISFVAEGYQNIHLLPIFTKKIAFGNLGFPWILTPEEKQTNYNKGICPVAEKLHERNFIGLGITSVDLGQKDLKRIEIAVDKVWANLQLLEHIDAK
jgi:perosamine synthetase